MSIRTELKEKLHKVTNKQAEEERRLELEAIKMIEEFVIPKFREIADAQPTSSILRIDFHSNIGCWNYTSNINNWDKRKNSPYDYSVVSKAVKIAFKFDIEGKIIDDGSGGDTLSFILDLR